MVGDQSWLTIFAGVFGHHTAGVRGTLAFELAFLQFNTFEKTLHKIKVIPFKALGFFLGPEVSGSGELTFINDLLKRHGFINCRV